MSNIPESVKLGVTCPGCGKQSEQPLGRLHDDQKFTCPGCGGDVRIQGEEIGKIDAAIKKFTDELAKSGVKWR